MTHRYEAHEDHTQGFGLLVQSVYGGIDEPHPVGVATSNIVPPGRSVSGQSRNGEPVYRGSRRLRQLGAQTDFHNTEYAG